MPGDPHEKMPTWLQGTVQVLIIYSVITVALQTMPQLADFHDFFYISEVIVVILFTIEYVACWALSDNKLRYPFRFLSLIDLLAILPFYLALHIDLRTVRVLRVLRIVRLLNLTRYRWALSTLGQAMRRVYPELLMTGMMVTAGVVIAGTALYYAEHEAQPDVYTSIPASLWWAVVTLSTVGYGDIYPVTIVGRLISTVIMIFGVGIIAVPSGLLASAMTEIIQERRRQEASREP